MQIISRPNILDSIIFLLLMSGPPRLRFRDPLSSLYGEIDWSILLNIIVWFLGALWIFFQYNWFHFIRLPLSKLKFIQVVSFLFVFALFPSVLISPFKYLSFYRVFQILIALLFLYMWISKFGVESCIKCLSYGYTILIILIVLAASFSPSLVLVGHRLRGDLIGNAGAIAVMGLIVAGKYPLTKNRFIQIILFLIFVFVLFFSRTRSAIFTFLFIISLVAIRGSIMTNLRKVIYIAFSSIPIALLSVYIEKAISWIIREQETVATLSDRIPLWQYTITKAMQISPLIGIGLYANRLILMSYNPGLGTSHSAFVEILVGGGILSFSIFCVLVFMLIYYALVMYFVYGQNANAMILTCLLISTLLIGFVSEEMIIASPTSFTFFALISLFPSLKDELSYEYYNGS